MMSRTAATPYAVPSKWKMPRTCTICKHDRRLEIDQALVDRVAFRDIAVQYGTTKSSLARHKDAHLPVQLAKAKQVKEVASAGTLLERIWALEQKSCEILKTAERTGALRVALMAIRETRSILELLARIDAERETKSNIVSSAEWIQLRETVLSALEPHPEIRDQVAEAIADCA